MFFSQKSLAGSKPNLQEPVSWIGIESAGVLGFCLDRQRMRKNSFCSFLPKSFQERTAVQWVEIWLRKSHLCETGLGFNSSIDTANHPCPVKSFQATVCVCDWSCGALTVMSVRTPSSFQGLNIQVTKRTDVSGVHLIYTSHHSCAVVGFFTH